MDLVSHGSDVGHEYRRLISRRGFARKTIQASALASIGCIASQSTTPQEHDLRLLSSAPKLAAWHTAAGPIVLASATKGGGTTPPAVTLAGNLNQALPLRIEIDNPGPRGTATFKWARNELGADSPLTLAPNWVQTGVTTAASVLLGSTGISAEFPSATYADDQLWNSVVSQWKDVDSQAGYELDNSTVSVSNSCIYEQSSFINNLPSIWFSPGMLGNQSNLAAVFNNNEPFHVFYMGHIETLATGNNGLVILAGSNQSQTSKDYLTLFFTGPSAVPSRVYSLQRISDVPVTRRINSTFQTGLAPHIWEIASDGAVLYLYMDGFLVDTIIIAGNLLINRYTVGGLRLGANAATLFGVQRGCDHAVYRDKLSDPERYDILRALS